MCELQKQFDLFEDEKETKEGNILLTFCREIEDWIKYLNFVIRNTLGELEVSAFHGGSATISLIVIFKHNIIETNRHDTKNSEKLVCIGKQLKSGHHTLINAGRRIITCNVVFHRSDIQCPYP